MQAPSETSPPTVHTDAHARPPRILVVDDAPLNRKLLSAILDREECEVLEAEGGARAIELARTRAPDLVLLDIMMPGMDGYEVCEALQADDLTRSIPIIFLSALSETADKVRGLELGAVDYVTKPFDRGEVLARVRSQVRIQRLSASLREANRELRAASKELQADLAAAADIQGALIPRTRPEREAFDMAWRYVPCTSIGGDVFNLVQLDEHHVGVYMIDVSGHGVPAAMVTVSVSQTLTPQGGVLVAPGEDGEAPTIRSPAEVMRMLDEEYPMERFDKYFTMFYLVLDTRTGELRYCNAAHPAPTLRRADGRLEYLSEGGTIIGMGGVMPFDEGRVTLAPGDRLFVFTDGIAEYTGDDGDFGEERLERHLARAPGGDVQATCDEIVDAVDAFGNGRHPNDDITIVGLEYRGRRPGDSSGT